CQGQQLKEVIGHHIAKRTRHIEVAAALFNTNGFRHCDLHVINVTAVPDRFKDAVAEAEYQDVLDRLFTEIMINEIDLILRKNFSDLTVQGFRGIKNISERLFKNDPPPMAVLFTSKLR